MARAKKAQPLSLNPLPDPIEEGNFSRLGIFSVQERIPATFTSWTRSFESDNVTATFSCASPAELGGVPHGIDAEFMQALINLYIENRIYRACTLNRFRHQRTTAPVSNLDCYRS